MGDQDNLKEKQCIEGQGIILRIDILSEGLGKILVYLISSDTTI
jgi:hypothetical protein